MAVALDQGHNNRLLNRLAVLLSASLGADVGFVSFQCDAQAAHRRNIRRRAGLHDLANAMSQEPSRLYRAVEETLNVASADALLGAGQEMDRLKPQMQGKLAVLKNRANAP